MPTEREKLVNKINGGLFTTEQEARDAQERLNEINAQEYINEKTAREADRDWRRG